MWQESEAIICTQRNHLNGLHSKGDLGCKTMFHSDSDGVGRGGQFQYTDLCSNFLGGTELPCAVFKLTSPWRVPREPGSISGLSLLQLGTELL